MATPLFDKIAVSFIQKIPTTFKTSFTPGNLMPDSYVLTKEQIADYVNRAMQKLFNDSWYGVQGNVKAFLKIFPELSKVSAELIPASAVYEIVSPHLDFFKVISGFLVTGNVFIKTWDEDKYSIALSEKYTQYTATTTYPALIQINKTITLFPQEDLAVTPFKLHYVKLPVDPSTGEHLTQNGSEDSPFYEHWNSRIAEIAEELYLIDTYQTT